jgi:N-acetylmuramoyl-L-alanine amidase
VLKAPDVPSVLLELGYLSSDKDVQNLTSPEWRDTATGSIVKAINAFFAPRQPDTHGTTAKQPPSAAEASSGQTQSAKRSADQAATAPN